LGFKSAGSKRVDRSDNSTPCPDCHGSRLKRESLSVRVGGENIAGLAALSIAELLVFFDGLELAEQRKAVGHKIAGEITSRLACLVLLGPRLSEFGPRFDNAFRRRGATGTFGNPDWVQLGGRALYSRRAEHRTPSKR
jgi:hypothetical protein